MNNIKQNKSYNQVCVWPGTILPTDQIESFVNHFAEQGFRIQYLETIMTAPDRDENNLTVESTGGRSDIFFAIHDDDIMRFAITRLQMGIKWIEDVLDNESSEMRLAAREYSIYPEHVEAYRKW